MAAVEALWAQIAGVTYSATEDRRVIAALATPGVVTGLVVTAGSGRNVNVSPGTGIVSDGGGGAFVAPLDDSTPLTITASSTESVFLVVDVATALVSVVAGSTPPTDPHLVLGSVKTTGSGLDPAYGNGGISMLSREQALPPAMAAGTGQALYLPLSGGVVTGPVQATRFVVPGLFDVGGPDVVPSAPEGIKLGGTSPTARHYCMLTAKAPSGGANVIGSATLESIRWNAPATTNNVSDYTRTPYGTTDYMLRAGVEGYYLVSGHATFEHTSADDNANVIREARLSVFTDGAADPEYEIVTAERSRTNPGAGDQCPLTGMVRLRADQHVRVRLFHNSTGGRNVASARVLFRLLQAN